MSQSQAGPFQSTPLMRGATRRAAQGARQSRFQSTPLMRGATVRGYCPGDERRVSIHAPHARGDGRRGPRTAGRDVSIHAPHARGDDEGAVGHRPVQVSIHAPHARGDGTAYYLPDRSNVSIHAPHARGDRCLPFSTSQTTRFNPRPSCEGRRVWQAAVKR